MLQLQHKGKQQQQIIVKNPALTFPQVVTLGNFSHPLPQNPQCGQLRIVLSPSFLTNMALLDIGKTSWSRISMSPSCDMRNE